MAIQQDTLRLESVKAALEWSKQITTLATATIVLSGTFLKDLFPDGVLKFWLILCWDLMVISIALGIVYLGMITSMLSQANPSTDIDIYSSGLRVAVIHSITFFLGLLAFCIFVGGNLFYQVTPVSSSSVSTPCVAVSSVTHPRTPRNTLMTISVPWLSLFRRCISFRRLTPERHGSELTKREVAEKDLQYALIRAQASAIMPYIIYRSMSTFSEDRWARFYVRRTSRFRRAYLSAAEQLRRIEEYENFPRVRRYCKWINDLVEKLPEHLRYKAYYPFAGLDVFWISAFHQLTMEDMNYNSSVTLPTTWWSLADYNTARLEKFAENLKQKNVLPKHHHVEFIRSNSEEAHNTRMYSRGDVTLICKSGQKIIELLTQLGQDKFAFGAVIIADESEITIDMCDFMTRHGYASYVKVGAESGTENPWSMSSSNAVAFIRE